MQIDSAGSLVCLGRDGVHRVYRYELTETQRTSYFKTNEKSACAQLDCDVSLGGGGPALRVYNAIFESPTPGRWIETTMALAGGKGSPHSAFGIPEAVIELAWRAVGGDLVSSSNAENHFELESERRQEDACKVWRRLVDKGRASYDSGCDRFAYTPGVGTG